MHLEKCCPGSEPSVKFRKGFIKALWAFPLKAPVWYSPEAWRIPNKCQRAILGIKLKVLSHPCSQPWGISTQNTTESFSFAQLREGRSLRKGSWLVRWRETQPGSPVGQQEVSPCHAHWRARCVGSPALEMLLLSGGGEKCLHKWALVHAVGDAAKWCVPSGDNVSS